MREREGGKNGGREEKEGRKRWEKGWKTNEGGKGLNKVVLGSSEERKKG